MIAMIYFLMNRNISKENKQKINQLINHRIREYPKKKIQLNCQGLSR
jgi:hypothetical protein